MEFIPLNSWERKKNYIVNKWGKKDNNNNKKHTLQQLLGDLHGLHAHVALLDLERDLGLCPVLLDVPRAVDRPREEDVHGDVGVELEFRAERLREACRDSNRI